jgi:hypothetical protein
LDVSFQKKKKKLSERISTHVPSSRLYGPALALRRLHSRDASNCVDCGYKKKKNKKFERECPDECRILTQPRQS